MTEISNENNKYLPIDPDVYLGLIPSICKPENYGDIFILDNFIIINENDPITYDQMIATAILKGNKVNNCFKYPYAMHVFNNICEPEYISGTPIIVMTFEKSAFLTCIGGFSSKYWHFNLGRYEGDESWESITTEFIKEIKKDLNIVANPKKINIGIDFYLNNIKKLALKYRIDADDYNYVMSFVAGKM